MACAALALGFAAAALQSWYVAAPVLAHRLNGVAIEGRLLSVEPLPEGTRLRWRRAASSASHAAQLPARIRISLKQDAPDLLPGQWLRLKAGLFPPSAPAMPGAYDFQRRAWFDRLGAVGFTRGAAETIAPPEGDGPQRWRVGVEAVREPSPRASARRCPAIPAPSPRR